MADKDRDDEKKPSLEHEDDEPSHKDEHEGDKPSGKDKPSLKAEDKDKDEAESEHEADEASHAADEAEHEDHDADDAAASKADEADDEPPPRRESPSERKKGAKQSRSGRLAQRRQPPKGSLAKSLMLFVIIVGTLIVAFAVLGREEPGGAGPLVAPKWTNGQTVDLELTIVPSDAKDLACASTEEIAGKKCQFETPTKAFTPPATDHKKVFQPYTTTDRIQIIAAGLWDEPSMVPAKLPNTRFSVKCKFTIDAKMKNPGIRWNAEGPWYPQQNDWYAGAVSNCTITPP